MTFTVPEAQREWDAFHRSHVRFCDRHPEKEQAMLDSPAYKKYCREQRKLLAQLRRQ